MFVPLNKQNFIEFTVNFDAFLCRIIVVVVVGLITWLVWNGGAIIIIIIISRLLRIFEKGGREGNARVIKEINMHKCEYCDWHTTISILNKVNPFSLKTRYLNWIY